MSVTAMLLGVAQDGGLPQPGCTCLNCAAARTNPTLRQQVVSLGLVDEDAGRAWLIDATPDFPAQYDALSAHAPLAGILLTHAHMGHYPGLLYLGPEAMHTRGMPVYATPRMAAFLRDHAPWSGLVKRGHVTLVEMEPGQEIALSAGLRATPVAVPHREEYSDTVAWLVRGPARTLFYCPDIDHWRTFQPDLRAWLRARGVHIALLDATFFAPDELPGRDLSRIPHPFARDTAALLARPPAEVVLIHLNHTNPLWRAGRARAHIERMGLRVGAQGARWTL
jgi:pyrroloquinoline quinone biosynthesis protein B